MTTPYKPRPGEPTHDHHLETINRLHRDITTAQALQWPKLIELAAHYGNHNGTPITIALIHAMHTLVEAADPTSTSPSEDTARVSRGDNTPTERGEAAFRRQRAIIRRVERDVAGLINSIYNDLEDRPRDTRAGGKGRQCKRRDCEQYNRKRQHTPRCGWCGETFPEIDEAAA